MKRNNSPPRRILRLEREKNNRAVAQQGWAPTLRLKFMRAPVAAVALVLAGDRWGSDILQLIQTFS